MLESGNVLIADGGGNRVIEIDRNENIVWEYSVPSHTMIKLLLIISLEIWALYVFEVSHLLKGEYKVLKKERTMVKKAIKRNIIPFLVVTLLVLVMVWPFKGAIRILFYITIFS